MKVFKILDDDVEYNIDEETYIEVTGLEKPYCISLENEDRYFAICPECDNPILICNLLKENTKRNIHGRHYPYSIEKLTDVDLHAMKACKYYTGNVSNPTERVQKGNLSNKLCSEMRNNFVNIIKYLEFLTGIHISNNFALELLDEWISRKKWEYAMCNIDTLAISLVFGRTPQNIMRRSIFRGSKLESELKKHYSQRIIFEDSSNPNMVHLECPENNYSNLLILIYRKGTNTKNERYVIEFYLQEDDDKSKHSIQFKINHEDRIKFFENKNFSSKDRELQDSAEKRFTTKVKNNNN